MQSKPNTPIAKEQEPFMTVACADCGEPVNVYADHFGIFRTEHLCPSLVAAARKAVA